ncbi:MAG: hypothetical protein K0U98_21890 [Deltaproteobacteria bacterium]|nr:hypothetical protein [Deltaproteobacteria bacterium]
MSMDERIQKLDEHVGNRVRQWLKDVHEQVGHQLGEEISRQLAAAGDLLPESLLTEEVVEPLRGARDASGDAVGLKRLKVATAAIDGARNQSEVLSELLKGGQGFASRLALFLTRADAASGWSGLGFGDGDDNLRGMTLDYQEDGPWYRLSLGKACVPLSAGDCGRLCSRLESALPKDGILIPIVLRDRVAAALYADRLSDGDVLDLDALQLLAYLAAQAIETLPFRERKTTTPTLLVEEEAEGEPAGLSLWGAAAATAAAAATGVVAGAVLGDDEGEEAESHSEAADIASADIASADIASAEMEESAPIEVTPEAPKRSETQDLAPTVAEALAEESSKQETSEAEPTEEHSEPTPVVDEFGVVGEAGEEVEIVEVEAGSIDYVEVEADAEEVEIADPPDTSAVEGVPESLPWETEDVVEERSQEQSTAVWEEQPAAPAESSGGGILWEAEEESPVVAEDEVVAEEVEEEPASVQWQTEPGSVAGEGAIPADSGLKTLQYTPPTLEPEATVAPEQDARFEGDETLLLTKRPSLVPPTPTPDPPPLEEAPAFDGDETHPGVATESPIAAPESPSVEPPAPAAARPAPRATEVAPPSDIDGPGWAFKSPMAVGEDSEMHDKAKRLARLLVSEIKLYNEEQVEEGQRNRDIYERLKEDIDRSRQMYEDRVDESIRSTNDYFYQELVRTLAAGDPQALGI